MRKQYKPRASVSSLNNQQMKLKYTLMISSLLVHATLFAQYTLKWEDNFDNATLNQQTNWTVEQYGDKQNSGNKELQYYRAANVTIENYSGVNCLVLNAKKENYSTNLFTSGRVTSRDKVFFKYGKIEARIKMPQTANGLWPAFWMMGDDYPAVDWPKCGEVDMLEMGNGYGITTGTQNRYYNGACHWGETSVAPAYQFDAKYTTHPTSLQDGFHLYTLIWDASNVKMYIDLDVNPNAAPYYTMSIAGPAVAGNVGMYFHKPYSIILNLAVGGSYTGITGDTNAGLITAVPSATPVKMYIDYVRIYQSGLTGEEYYGPNIQSNLPSAPTSVTATAGDSQASVAFVAPLFNGGSAITSYIATSNPGGITKSGTSSPLVVTGLNNGTSYTFTVTALNSTGSSYASTPSNAVIPSLALLNIALNKTTIASSQASATYAPLKATDGVTATQWRSVSETNPWIYVDLGSLCNFNRVKLNWSSIFGRDYKLQTSVNGSTWVDLATLTAQNGAVDDITGLSGSARYVRIYVTARSKSNSGVFLAEFEIYGSVSSNTVDTTPPTSPTNLSSSSVTSTSFTLSWLASTDAVGVTGYEVYRNGVLFTTVTSTSALINGLTAGSSYSMTVRAKDAAGNLSAPSATLSQSTTQAPISFPGNLGFEDDFTSWATYGTATINTNAANVYSGIKSAYFSNGGANFVMTGLTPGATYTLKGWVKAVSGIDIWITASNYGGANIGQQMTSTTWTQSGNIVFTMGATNTSVTLATWTGATSSAYFDGYTLTTYVSGQMSAQNQDILSGKVDVTTVDIYPNPASNSFNISAQSDNAKITVSSLDGKILKSLNANSKITTIETSNWASGMYIIQVQSGTSNIFKKLLIAK